MNCKPGDLALWVTRGALVNVDRVFDRDELFPDTAGWLHLFAPSVGIPSFVVTVLGAPQKNQMGTAGTRGKYFQQTPVRSTSLRPIRDPGEDATDEMVALLGKPSSLPHPSKEHA